MPDATEHRDRANRESGVQHKVPVIMGSTARDFTPGAAPPTGLDSLIDQAYGPLASRGRSRYTAEDPLYGSREVHHPSEPELDTRLAPRARRGCGAGPGTAGRAGGTPEHRTVSNGADRPASV